MRGLEFALNDIGLALFTTLAPAAAFSYVVLALVALLGRLDERARRCLESWLILPLALATVGLIASATHLGTPGNALYVFNRVGASPLSTEVLAAVTFLGLSCSYWLAGVYAGSLRHLRAVWLTLSVASALVFVWGTTHAYSMPTVISWDTAFARANLPLAGLSGCAVLTLLVLVCAGQGHRRRLVGGLAGLSAAATLAACASMALQYADLAEMRNGFGTAAELVPLYPLAIAGFAACALGALAVGLAAMRRLWADTGGAAAGFEGRTEAEKRALRRLVCACVLSYLGIFAVRFCFYCSHMTSGVV